MSLKDGLFSFDTRHCNRSTEYSIAPGLTDVLPDALRNQVLDFALTGGTVAAPPCKQQPRYDVSGKVTQFPQLEASVQGARFEAPKP
jgi:hypothetical protein